MSGRNAPSVSAWVCSAVVVLLAFHAAALAFIAVRHSPTWDEPGHLVSGIVQWQFGRSDLYRVNPPLVRMVAAIPVLATGFEADWRHFTDVPGSRPEFVLGKQFVEANGPRTFLLMTAARWFCIPLSVLGGAICFLWAREAFGSSAGLLALTLWAFDPNVLAHGALITPDAAAASLGAAAGYTFWRWLSQPRWASALLAGAALGVAALTKTTWATLFPLWFVLWGARALAGREARGRFLRGTSLQFAAITAMGIYLMNAGYGFSGTCRRLDQFQFSSALLSGCRDGVRHFGESGNRFSGSAIGSLRLPLPADYILGIDLQRRDFERTTCSYLGGQWRDHGWWYYYLYALAVKVPLGTWVLVVLAIGASVFSRRYSAGWRDEVVLLAPVAVILVLVSSQTGMNHHMRYVLPIFPFAFIWMSKVASAGEFGHRLFAAVVGLAALSSAVSSLLVYPHSLSYFSELAGGPKNGHWHLLNSNIDWGQDLLYLKEWYDAHPEARPLRVAYFGTCDPKVAGIDSCAVPPVPCRVDGRSWGLFDGVGPSPGWHALSVNEIHRETREYEYFLRMAPVAMAGYSIYIYHVTREEADRVRRELGLPELRDER